MDTPHHRRDFVRSLTLAASAAALGASGAVSADEPKKTAEEPKTETTLTEADARMELVIARFGKQLDPEARKAVRAEIAMMVRRAEGLRKFALENGDGPFPVFHPYRAPLA